MRIGKAFRKKYIASRYRRKQILDILTSLEVVFFFILLGLSAFFSSSETSLFSLDNRQLEQMRVDKNPRIDLILNLIRQPRRLIVTVLIGNELVNVAASVISASIVIRLLGAEKKWVNLLIMVPLLLLIGEITPKTLAIRRNIQFATFQSRFIDLFARMISPLRWAIRRISDYFITLIVGKERSRTNILTEDMVRSLAREGVGEGTLDNKEAQYINQIFEFGGKTVGEVMTPRSQIFFLPSIMSPDQMALELHRTRNTNASIYGENEDDVIGVLFARDLLGVDLKNASASDLQRLLRKPYFVPESRTVVDLFHAFRKRKLSLALTVDEYGGITGLVTMADLLECIFGDIPSESERLKQQMIDHEIIGEDQYRLEGPMPIQQFNALTGANFSDESVETIGGMLLNRFGEVPPQGARTVIDRYEFVVVSTANHRIDEITVKYLPKKESAPEAAALKEEGYVASPGKGFNSKEKVLKVRSSKDLKQGNE